MYVQAFGKLAKTNNTIILPSNAGDINSMVGQAMTIYQALAQKPALTAEQGYHQQENDYDQELHSDKEDDFPSLTSNSNYNSGKFKSVPDPTKQSDM